MHRARFNFLVRVWMTVDKQPNLPLKQPTELAGLGLLDK